MLQTLREHFGHECFRDGQEKVIRALLENRPALAVFPTGGGKSLCYQLPAVILDGITLVISPLIALMKDQVDALSRRGIAAARLDSTLDTRELQQLHARLETGAVKLLYIAPERLANEAFRKRVRQLNVVMVAIDEAHCISEWGHNFRPDYLKLAAFCRTLKVRRVLALTATATPEVARDIRRCFRISAADHVQLSFHRPNLDLRITPSAAEARNRTLLERLRDSSGAAIVYVTRQETAEEVATYLARHRIAARAYHAGLLDEFRSEAQRSFMSGETRVIVATIAFGMGIDKADIRRVIHYNLPKSLENYTQEIGRAGRDGLPAVCEMLACGDDLTVLENFIHSDTPSPRALENLIGRVLRLGETFDVSLHDLSVSCDVRTAVVQTLLAYLENDGILEATGTFYAQYRLKPLRGNAPMLAGLPRNHRNFLATLLDRATPGRSWLKFAPCELAAQLGVSRTKIVAALTAIEAAGEAKLSVSGMRHSYRIKKDPGKLQTLAAAYSDLFHRREQADLARLAQVLGLATHGDCLTACLTRHFGEVLPSPCGHCDRCRGVSPSPIERPATRPVSDEEWRTVTTLVREKHAELATPRQLARFLCGMNSPASTHARLNRHPAFGLLNELPFAEVLALAEAL